MRAHPVRALEKRRSTRNGSRLRDNVSRIIIKREKTAVVYDIIQHRLRKLLLAVNSPRFLRLALRSMYLRIVSVVRVIYRTLRAVCCSTAREVRPRDGNGDKEISSGFVTAEDRDHASRTRR